MNDNRKILNGLLSGTPLFLEIEGLPERLHSILIGMSPKKFILVSAPKQSETESGKIYPLLYAGNNLTCCTMCPGTALGFKSHIIRFVVSPFPMLFLSYPASIELVNVRKHERIRCLFEAVLHAGQKTVKGMITDLSKGGCSFVFPSREAADSLDINTLVTLESKQLEAENENSLQAKVRSKTKNTGSERLGLQFDAMTESMANNLREFIAEALRLGQA